MRPPTSPAHTQRPSISQVSSDLLTESGTFAGVSQCFLSYHRPVETGGGTPKRGCSTPRSGCYTPLSTPPMGEPVTINTIPILRPNQADRFKRLRTGPRPVCHGKTQPICASFRIASGCDSAQTPRQGLPETRLSQTLVQIAGQSLEIRLAPSCASSTIRLVPVKCLSLQHMIKL